MTTTGNIYIWVNIIAGTMSWLLSLTRPETGGASSSMAGAFSSSSLSLSLITWILFLFLESSYLDRALALFVFFLDWTRGLVLSASLLGYCWCVCLQGGGCGPPWSWLPRTWCNCRGSGTSRRRNTSLRERELRTGSFRNFKVSIADLLTLIISERHDLESILLVCSLSWPARNRAIGWVFSHHSGIPDWPWR